MEAKFPRLQRSKGQHKGQQVVTFLVFWCVSVCVCVCNMPGVVHALD